MSKRNLILMISIAAILIIGVLLFFFSSSGTPTQPQQQATTTNPFGGVSGNRDIGTNTENQVNQISTSTNFQNKNKLIQLYRNPTSGAVFFTNKNNQTILRFVDRGMGNIYEYTPDNHTGEVSRITNTTIPKIQEVVWSNLGNNLVLRYLDDNTDDINSYYAKIQASNSTDVLGEISGAFLTKNLKQISANPKGDKFFTLNDKSDKSGTFGYIANFDGTNKKMVFDSPISYWNISWPKENIVALTTKPNYTDPGMLYFFNTQTYSLERVLSGIIGLSTLTNKNADLIAYSYTTNNTIYLAVYDYINKINKNVVIQTIADKCVWGNINSKVLYCAVPKNIPSNSYPDAWYIGLQLFNDDIWKLDTDTGEISQLYSINTNDAVDMDGFDLKISPDDKYISITNKNDLSLWLLEIK